MSANLTIGSVVLIVGIAGAFEYFTGVTSSLLDHADEQAHQIALGHLRQEGLNTYYFEHCYFNEDTPANIQQIRATYHNAYADNYWPSLASLAGSGISASVATSVATLICLLWRKTHDNLWMKKIGVR